ncbi:MAG: PEP-CTERM sorting domain-containing protein [Pirellulales bacterium]
MNCGLALTLLAVTLMAFGTSSVQADDIDLELEFDTSFLTWNLYAEVNTTGGIDGSNGIAAVRAMVDNIDFGTLGDAVNIAGGIGAIDPIDAGGPNERDPVLQTAGGTLDIIYGQDISDAPSVVGGVGVGGRTLIADGTFASAGTPPAFGDDDSGLFSDGNFLDVFPGPFGGALGANAVNTSVTDITGPTTVPADLNQDGFVDGLDLGIQLGNWGADVTPLQGELNGVVPVDGLDLGILLGAWDPPAVAASTAVPEPSSIALLALSSLSLLVTRRKR